MIDTLEKISRHDIIDMTRIFQTAMPMPKKQERFHNWNRAFIQMLMSKGMMTRIRVGHQAQDFLRSCTFGGLECTIDDDE